MTPVGPPPWSGSEPDQPDWVLLDRYLAAECTEFEVSRVQAWLAGDPGRQAMLADLAGTRRVVAAQPSAWDTAVMWRAIAGEAALPLQDQHDSAPHPYRVDHLGDRSTVPRSYWWPRWVGRADRRASAWRVGSAWTLAALMAAGIGLWGAQRVRMAASGRPGREYVTAPGQRATVTLPDGTRIMLAPASHLRVAANYATERAVALEGEAVFAARHDAAHPFTVRARGAVARDVGTQFDVRVYPEDARVRVVVVEGAVALGAAQADQSVSPARVVAAGSLAEVDAVGQTTVAAITDVDRYLDWMHGELVFRHAPLSAIVADLARFYGRPIRLGDSTIGAERVSGTFSVDAPDEALSGLARAAGARAIRDSDGGTTFLRTP